MNYRKLGNLTVSEIGFGTWGIGGLTAGATSYGPTNDKTSLAAIQTALVNRLNFFDTSNVYGDGHSEELIGQAVKKWERKKVVIATKGGLSKHKGQFDLSPPHLKKSLEASLCRLQTDYVDLYQLHMDDHHDLQTVAQWKALETLYQLKEEGLIREIGISLKSPQDGLTAIAMGFQVLQVNFSLLDQRAWDCGLLELAEEKKVNLIARTPFCFGFLSGQIRNKESLNFGSRDHRSTWPREQLEKWLEASRIFKQLNRDFRPARYLSEFALKFCLYPKAVSTVIPGIMTPAEAAQNAIASTWPDLTKEEVEQIRKIYKENNGFFVGNKK